MRTNEVGSFIKRIETGFLNKFTNADGTRVMLFPRPVSVASARTGSKLGASFLEVTLEYLDAFLWVKVRRFCPASSTHFVTSPLSYKTARYVPRVLTEVRSFPVLYYPLAHSTSHFVGDGLWDSNDCRTMLEPSGKG